MPLLGTRFDPWEYDREIYNRRNVSERLFRRLKGLSRIEKLDLVFLGFIIFALIIYGLR